MAVGGNVKGLRELNKLSCLACRVGILNKIWRGSQINIYELSV